MMVSDMATRILVNTRELKRQVLCVICLEAALVDSKVKCVKLSPILRIELINPTDGLPNLAIHPPNSCC